MIITSGKLKIPTVEAARPALAVGLFSMAIVGIVWTVIATVTFDTAIDFHSYRDGATRWLSGGSMYAPAQLAGPYGLSASAGHVFLYPPTAMPVLLVLTSLGLVPFVVLSTIAFLAGLIALAPRTSIWIGAICAAVVFSDPFVAAASVGNVAMLVGALLAWGYLGRAGIIGALGGMTKLTPGAIAALDGSRGLVTGVSVAAVIAIVSLPIIGPSNWSDYATAMVNARPTCLATSSVACATGSTVLPLVLGALLVLACLATHWRLLRLALVTAALLVMTPELFPQYLVYAYPLIVASASAVHARLAAGPASVQVVGPVDAAQPDDHPEHDQDLPARPDRRPLEPDRRPGLLVADGGQHAQSPDERNRVERVAIAVLEPAAAVVEQGRDQHDQRRQRQPPRP